MVASTVCVMDATTILGRRVNEGESAWTTQDLVNGEAPSLWQGEIKNQKKLCKHSCRHPKGPVDRGWRSSPGPAKKAQCVVQNWQNGLRKRSTRRPTCPLGRPVDRVWMGAAQGLRKGPCGGVKSPKTGCTSAALDVSMVVTSHHHGYIHQSGGKEPLYTIKQIPLTSQPGFTAIVFALPKLLRELSLRAWIDKIITNRQFK
ncbi:hypothetical protein B0H14DRAFT_2647157 [Mycena olivaceomarginata]|nr:hypothetical protein B0H14DRAFT_2647157 [Mycena olivaceomarginata]